MTITRRSGLRISFLSAACAAALAIAGCGDDSGGGGGSGDLADYAPADSPLYIEGVIRPEGELGDNIEALVENVSGLSDPGQLLIDQINQGLAEDPESEDFTYEDDIEPWLGERAGLAVGSFTESAEDDVVAVIEVTDTGAAQDFLDRIVETSSEDLMEASYEGVDYVVESEGAAVGIVDDVLAVGGTEAKFEELVDAGSGEGLSSDEDFEQTISEAPDESLVDFYIDSTAFLEEIKKQSDPAARQFFDSLGAQGDQGAAVASLIPEADRVEFQAVSTAENPAGTGAATELLESFPSDSFAAFAVPEVGEALAMGLDQLDEVGIPGEVPPGQLKAGLNQFGVDIDEIASAIGDVGIYAQGTDLQTIGGALVITTDDPETIASSLESVNDLLKRERVPGYTAITGNATGFAIRNPQELGPRPLVILTAGDRLAVGYGEKATEQALSPSQGEGLADNPVFGDATEALDGVDPSGFVDFASVFELIENVRPDVLSDTDYQQARPYLEKLGYLVFGSGEEGDLTTARFILGLSEE